MKHSSRLITSLVLVLALAVVLAACAPAPQTPAVQAASMPTMAQQPAKVELMKVKAPVTGEPNVHFSLKTGIAEGKMVYIGVGGELEGKVNPDLMVMPGDIVEIIVIDGDGVLHDISIPEEGVLSDKISAKGSQARVIFLADQPGSFAYFCSQPGHRQAGMEGKLVVGSPSQSQAAAAPSIVRLPDDLPGPLPARSPQKVMVNLEAVALKARLADNTTYTYWTFNGKVPGPFVRVRVGDTVEVHLKNSATDMNHSVDFHAVTGPGGGAAATVTPPGGETSFTFKALKVGLFVYHCATPMVAEHIANGMYGLILVEPEAGLPKVDREFYVMQGEIYTEQAFGQTGDDTFSQKKLLDEDPEYFVLNGAVGALTKEHPLTAKVGETVRIFFGDAGPNFISSFHLIGEIFDRVYDQGSLTSPPLTDVQTTLVPAGGATMVELSLEVPGKFILVDHALSRMERGLAGYLMVDGPANPDIFNGVIQGNSGH